jgi:hypothetical protein
MYQDVDIFQEGGPADKDLLDIAVEGYEENVPLLGQVAAGFTPPGMAMDIAAAGKYGRDSFRDFSQGNIGKGFGNLGIAALSGLAAVPLVGELANLAKQPLKKGIASLPSATNKADILKHQADINTGNPLADANKLYDRAVRVAPEFNQQIDNLASNINLKTSLPEQIGKIDGATGQPIGKVKKIPRMVEKARDKYNNDVSQLTDPIRTRVLVKTPAEEEAFVQMLKQNYEVFDKGRLVKPEGFVDRKILIKFTDTNGEQIVGEVSTITAPMWRASNTNHALFEEFRSLFPKGMPTDPKELELITDNVVNKGRALQKAMSENFVEAKKQIDPDFYKTEVKKFSKGGYVTAGSSGRSAPITPNVFEKSDFDISDPSTKKSATWLGIASVQSELPGAMKYPLYPASVGFTTAGPSSQPKYNVSLSINPSLQKFTKNYNPNEVNIFEVE